MLIWWLCSGLGELTDQCESIQLAHGSISLGPDVDILGARNPRLLEIALARRGAQPAHQTLRLGYGITQ